MHITAHTDENHAGEKCSYLRRMRVGEFRKKVVNFLNDPDFREKQFFIDKIFLIMLQVKN